MTVVGTRPEIIRLSLIIPLLDRYAEHVLVHTGQNFAPRLSDIFFEELGVRAPDMTLSIRGDSFGTQVGDLFARIEPVFLDHHPDRLLLLGDTNSALCAVVARRLGIPVYHMEAGNRCFDDRVPEEINRRIIDQSSTVLMPYTENSRRNLLAEGFPPNRILVTGNPIKQVLDHYAPRIDASSALEDLGLKDGSYFLVTLHRAENVDDPDRLAWLMDVLGRVHERFGLPVVCSVHPRTRIRLEGSAQALPRGDVRLLEPFGFFDFVRLERSAFCVLTDSGTVQEECSILRVPCVTLRDVTERPETVEVGSNALASDDADNVIRLVELSTTESRAWRPPPEYEQPEVATTVARILLSYRIPDAAEVHWRTSTNPA